MNTKTLVVLLPLAAVGCLLLAHSLGGGKAHAQHPHSHADPHGEQPDFVARHIEKQATITLRGPIDVVWPLFDPLNEGKWATAWKPEIFYPRDGSVREGMVMRTHGSKGDKGGLVWVVRAWDRRQRASVSLL